MQRFVSMPNTYAWKRFYGDSDPSCQELMLCMKCLLVRTMLRVEHVYMEWLSRVEHMLCMERLCGDCHAWNTCYAWNVYAEPVTCRTQIRGMAVTRRTHVRHEMSMRTLSRVEDINVEWLSRVNNEINCNEHRIQWRVPDDCIGYSCTNANKGFGESCWWPAWRTGW